MGKGSKNLEILQTSYLEAPEHGWNIYRVAGLSSRMIASTTALWFTRILSGHPAARSNKTVIAFHVSGGGEHIL